MCVCVCVCVHSHTHTHTGVNPNCVFLFAARLPLFAACGGGGRGCASRDFFF